MKISITSLLGWILLALVAVFIIPWERITWGSLRLAPSTTVTVTGDAKQEQANQIAQFTAGVMVLNSDKDKAVSEVNQKVESLIQSVKDFGIPEQDIKTQNLSIYQQEEPITLGGRQKSQPGDWRVSNDVLITLRQVDRASDLADVLTKSGATNVYGPNLTVDDTQAAQVALTDQVMQNAQEKAEAIAKSSDRKLGKVLSVSETGTTNIMPMYDRAMGGGGGVPVETGTSTVYKSLTVTFELK